MVVAAITLIGARSAASSSSVADAESSSNCYAICSIKRAEARRRFLTAPFW